MKTYEQWKTQLDEMEYQPPPKPVPKAPIERKAQQPETRKAPSINKEGGSISQKLKHTDKHDSAGTARATPSSTADHPTDPRSQNKKSPTKTRVVLSGIAGAVQKRRKGKGSETAFKGKKPQSRTGSQTRKQPPQAPSKFKF